MNICTGRLVQLCNNIPSLIHSGNIIRPGITYHVLYILRLPTIKTEVTVASLFYCDTIISLLLVFNASCIYSTARKTDNCCFIEVYCNVLVDRKIRKDTSESLSNSTNSCLKKICTHLSEAHSKLHSQTHRSHDRNEREQAVVLPTLHAPLKVCTAQGGLLMQTRKDLTVCL